jgi:iron(III) transport system ATP-binding protein
VLLLDEPLGALDLKLRQQMQTELKAIQQRVGITFIYVTHDQAEALAVSDQIVVMDAGRIAQAGTPAQLYEQPATEFVAGFMGEAMLFDAVAQGDGSVQIGPLTLVPRSPVVPGAIKLAVRPEAWSVRAEGEAPLAARLAKVAYLGAVVELSFETELGSIFVVSDRVDRAWVPGDAAALALGQRGVAVLAPLASTGGPGR